jgi:hypothetical protein
VLCGPLKAAAMERTNDKILGNGPLALPVIAGARWFGPEVRPYVLRVEVPLTAEQMVAALYDVAQQDEISSDENLCGSVAVTLLIEGLPRLEARAARLAQDEHRGAVESPEFLAFCRQRVAALLAG